jgi:hypothetical protein
MCRGKTKNEKNYAEQKRVGTIWFYKYACVMTELRREWKEEAHKWYTNS